MTDTISEQDIRAYFADTLYFTDTDLSRAQINAIEAAALRGLHVAAPTKHAGLQAAIEVVERELQGLRFSPDGSEKALIGASMQHVLQRVKRLLRRALLT
jgi:hypothetical protein